MGVRKKRRVRRLFSICSTSLRWTFMAERNRVRPINKVNWISKMRGKSNITGVIVTFKTKRKMISIGRLRRKFIILERTATIGSTSAGKTTFFMRCPPLRIDAVPCMSDVENHNQGRRPVKRNAG